ncbi:MAG: acyltransferase [Candidatus Bathyarchaeota archaeon]|nr:acyltransferase [Candidatus Termiticorpusculum sp.]
MSIQKSDSRAISADLIRVVAIAAVLVLHAGVYGANMIPFYEGVDVWRGGIVNVYMCFGYLGVPLFLMLSGALLLVPSKKDEELGVFFKKRFSRVGLPFLFWGAIYFLWDIYIENQLVTQEFIVKSILLGPYITFWYLYLLAGLYLITPMLRVMVAHFTDKHFKYFIGLWFAGTMLTTWIKFLSGSQYAIDSNLFVIPLCVGYFVMGAYLVKVQIHRRILAALTVLGLSLTAITSYLVSTYSGKEVLFFQEYASPTIMLTSISLFLLLNSYAKSKSNAFQIEKLSWKQRIIQVISENSLPIYLLHMIPLSLIKNGFFSFAVNGNTVDPIIGVPILAGLTLILSLMIIIPLKKIPILKKFIG